MTARLALFEDFTVGSSFRSPGATVVTAERIARFAADFDPQPLPQTDPERAPHHEQAGTIASGWHTAAVAMRLLVESDLGLHGQGAGVAVKSLRWPKPVRPGDTLRAEGVVTGARLSRSRPDSGVVEVHVVVRNQADQVVLEAEHVILVRRRTPPPPG